MLPHAKGAPPSAEQALWQVQTPVLASQIALHVQSAGQAHTGGGCSAQLGGGGGGGGGQGISRHVHLLFTHSYRLVPHEV
jgi:hypothetical protein